MTTEAVPDLASLLSQSVVHPLPPSQVELYLSRAPFVPLQGIVNFRTLTSPTIPPNLIYRFGALSLAPALTLAQLLTTYNIRTIYDLRSAAEREEAPSPVIRGVETVWIPNTADGTVYLKDENGEQRKKDVPEDVPKELFAEGDGVKAWIRKYGDILDMHGHIYKAVFERLRDGDQGAILFHCIAGKDRTGVLAALILALAHTPRAAIAYDYTLTRIGVEPYRDYLFKVFFGMKIDVAAGLAQSGVLEMCETWDTTILGFLDWMDERWGDVAGEQKSGKEDDVEVFPGVHGWLVKEMGFEEDDLERIRSNLRVVNE